MSIFVNTIPSLFAGANSMSALLIICENQPTWFTQTSGTAILKTTALAQENGEKSIKDAQIEIDYVVIEVLSQFLFRTELKAGKCSVEGVM